MRISVIATRTWFENRFTRRHVTSFVARSVCKVRATLHTWERERESGAGEVNFRGGFSSVACDAILLCLRPHGRHHLPSFSLSLADCRAPSFFPSSLRSYVVTALVREGCRVTLRLSGRAPAHACSHARTTDLILCFTSGKRSSKTVVSLNVFAVC